MKKKQMAYQKDPVEVETLFKAEEPYMKIEEPFHGYQGVILRNKVNDTIQCHLCGLWFQYLAPHVKKAHQYTLEQYRLKFSLPLNAPLCSKKFSKSSHDVSLTWDTSHIMKLNQGRPFKRTPDYYKRLKYSLNNMGRINAIGACEEQVQKRYLLVADKVGKEPTTNELKKHDFALTDIIQRRYGGLIAFCDKFGYAERRKPFSREYLINKIREKAKELNRLPIQSDFVQKPNRKAIIRMFGSYKRALSVAGLI